MLLQNGATNGLIATFMLQEIENGNQESVNSLNNVNRPMYLSIDIRY
jgi:hypothetical protein